MISLSEINARSLKFEEDEKIRIQMEADGLTEEQEFEFNTLIKNLEYKLIISAEAGNRTQVIGWFSIFCSKYFNYNELMIDDKLSFYSSFVNKLITEHDIIASMTGVVKRLYNYLCNNNLKPYIEYKSVSSGDERIYIIISW